MFAQVCLAVPYRVPGRIYQGCIRRRDNMHCHVQFKHDMKGVPWLHIARCTPVLATCTPSCVLGVPMTTGMTPPAAKLGM